MEIVWKGRRRSARGRGSAFRPSRPDVHPAAASPREVGSTSRGSKSLLPAGRLRKANRWIFVEIWWASALNAQQSALPVSGSASSYPWWLDVETGNSWQSDTTMNVADLQGMVAALRDAGATTVSVYSTTSRLADAAPPGEDAEPHRSTRRILDRLGELLNQVVTPDEQGWVGTGGRLERVGHRNPFQVRLCVV